MNNQELQRLTKEGKHVLKPIQNKSGKWFVGFYTVYGSWSKCSLGYKTSGECESVIDARVLENPSKNIKYE